MTEETTTLTGQAPPPVRDWPPLDLPGTEFDPVLAELMREGPLTRDPAAARRGLGVAGHPLPVTW